jgi:hypothetical protein
MGFAGQCSGWHLFHLSELEIKTLDLLLELPLRLLLM